MESRGGRGAAGFGVRLIVDMNLSPEWVQYLQNRGFDATHWSTVGPSDAQDREIMRWARDNGHVVLTHDLDFGLLLAHTKDSGPSVVQARVQDVSTEALGATVVTALQVHRAILERGALMTIDPSRTRIRILPI
jgi:predicted nuclease of predicted toxin-antitoxin system